MEHRHLSVRCWWTYGRKLYITELAEGASLRQKQAVRASTPTTHNTWYYLIAYSIISYYTILQTNITKLAEGASANKQHIINTNKHVTYKTSWLKELHHRNTTNNSNTNDELLLAGDQLVLLLLLLLLVYVYMCVYVCIYTYIYTYT